ncbi:exopolysaccharide biosynthesis protein [Clavibacter michiganensis]|uniref:Exopolysaccharide biosynthesis protein n=1 Tax=Clavibacter michiganensis TaxID=28447 RepID=A0A2S5VY33_9MICO|nr:phosphodiester glycosidase family protein [Clavibacter michiganensis]PPF71065.1 exopolysaccharide biosynthesis protein [Clavibacter michiganensis]
MTHEPTRRPSRRTFLLGGAAALGLAATGTGWALDRFVVPHVEIDDVDAFEAANASTDTASTSTGTATVTVTTRTQGSGDDLVTYYVADLLLTDATALRSAFADDAFGENIIDTTSSIAAQNDAAFAINGDYYGFRDTGIVIRNGVAFRDAGAREGLAFYRDGHAEVYDETATSADALVAAGVWNTLSFGPAVVRDGAEVAGIYQVEVDTNFGNHSIQGRQPRTCVGVIAANYLSMVVVDGRSTGYSAGVTLPDLAAIMLDLGCETAYNIDGGGSTTMVHAGELVNRPLGTTSERGTSDILYIPTSAA